VGTQDQECGEVLFFLNLKRRTRKEEAKQERVPEGLTGVEPNKNKMPLLKF
jgi:hypothetical protein